MLPDPLVYFDVVLVPKKVSCTRTRCCPTQRGQREALRVSDVVLSLCLLVSGRTRFNVNSQVRMRDLCH